VDFLFLLERGREDLELQALEFVLRNPGVPGKRAQRQTGKRDMIIPLLGNSYAKGSEKSYSNGTYLTALPKLR
jgi:hypothetical protein